MYLYGASGHAKVIVDILNASGESVDGLFDDDRSLEVLLNYPVSSPENVKSPLIISIGDNKIRKRIANSLYVNFGTAIHPSAIISQGTIIGEGSVVMQGGIIQSCVTIGRHCIINTGSSIDHDCQIGDFVHISPRAVLCGNIMIDEGSWIGAGAVIIPNVRIGKWCVIGAGSVVTKNIPDYSLALGNRCEIIRELE